MRRAALALVLLVLAVAFAAGCGGEEEGTPTPETVTGRMNSTRNAATPRRDLDMTDTSRPAIGRRCFFLPS